MSQCIKEDLPVINRKKKKVESNFAGNSQHLIDRCIRTCHWKQLASQKNYDWEGEVKVLEVRKFAEKIDHNDIVN